MYNRGHSHDPLVCVDGWANKCVYVEGSWTGALDQLAKGGANVFIRNSKTQGSNFLNVLIIADSVIHHLN